MTGGPSTPDVTVSIVDHKSGDLIFECLRSLFGSTSLALEVIVIQNVSGERSRAAEFPEVELICNEQVQGFATNHNKAIERGRGRYHLVLNDDTIIQTHAIDRLVTFADAHSTAGAIGPRLIGPDGDEAPPSRFPSAARELAHAVPLGVWPGSLRLSYGPEERRRAFQPDWISGACMLLRRRALERVGLFDTAFFMYYEDVDLCFRFRTSGWQIWYLPDAQVVHLVGRTTGRHTTRAWTQGQKYSSRLRYFGKHCGRAQTAALRAGMILLDALKCLKWHLLWRIDPSPERHARWQLARLALGAYLDG
jgi:N-acetylglucosaminyl-diphospho-decaprenol L-rhamnosyltransferase